MSTPLRRLAFLHRRPFWAVFLVLQIAISAFLNSLVFGFNLLSTDFYAGTVGFMGASVFGVVLDTFLDNMVDAITLIAFLVFYIFVLYKTFKKHPLQLRYPILLTISWIASTFIIILVVSHL